METTKLVLTWKDYFILCDQLVDMVRDSNFTDIIGISRGGLIPSQYLAYKLKIPRVHSFGMSSYSKDDKRLSDWDTIIFQNVTMEFNEGSRILIVDDIADSGKTLQRCKISQFYVGSLAQTIKTATLQYKPETSIICPDFFAQSIFGETWVIYPYDL